jgi:hypothetical protein
MSAYFYEKCCERHLDCPLLPPPESKGPVEQKSPVVWEA